MDVKKMYAKINTPGARKRAIHFLFFVMIFLLFRNKICKKIAQAIIEVLFL